MFGPVLHSPYANSLCQMVVSLSCRVLLMLPVVWSQSVFLDRPGCAAAVACPPVIPLLCGGIVRESSIDVKWCCLGSHPPLRRDHLLSRYAKRIARELAKDAAQLDMAPPEDRAAHKASAQARSLLGLLKGCCRAGLYTKGQAREERGRKNAG